MPFSVSARDTPAICSKSSICRFTLKVPEPVESTTESPPPTPTPRHRCSWEGKSIPPCEEVWQCSIIIRHFMARGRGRTTNGSPEGSIYKWYPQKCAHFDPPFLIWSGWNPYLLGQLSLFPAVLTSFMDGPLAASHSPRLFLLSKRQRESRSEKRRFASFKLKQAPRLFAHIFLFGSVCQDLHLSPLMDVLCAPLALFRDS